MPPANWKRWLAACFCTRSVSSSMSAGPSPVMRSWSVGEMRTVNWFGTRTRSRETTAAFVSISRRRAAVTSSGLQPALEGLGEGAVDDAFEPFSKLSRIPKRPFSSSSTRTS